MAPKTTYDKLDLMAAGRDLPAKSVNHIPSTLNRRKCSLTRTRSITLQRRIAH